jgi:hypothetical protein
MHAWPLDQSPNTAAITTRQVLEEKKEIRVVVHYEDDGSWAFLCGTTGEEKDRRVIAMSEAIELDDSLMKIADLPPGWKAWRESRMAPWQKIKNKEV